MGVTRYWRYSEKRMAELIREGRIVQAKPGLVPRYKRYLDKMTGVSLQDIWTDIKPVGRNKRQEYPTEKPDPYSSESLGQAPTPATSCLTRSVDAAQPLPSLSVWAEGESE